MTFGVRHRDTSLDGLVSDAGIGLEEIGHRIAVERGQGRRRSHHLNLQDIADEVTRLLPFDGHEWASRSTEVYNDVKHADRGGAGVSSMQQSLRENRLVFRIWLARRLGVAERAIRERMWQLER